jgi:hypothetical protein
MLVVRICVLLIDIAHADNQIGDEGARALAEALKTNKAVTHVDASCKKFCQGMAFWFD